MALCYQDKFDKGEEFDIIRLQLPDELQVFAITLYKKELRLTPPYRMDICMSSSVSPSMVQPTIYDKMGLSPQTHAQRSKLNVEFLPCAKSLFSCKEPGTRMSC